LWDMPMDQAESLPYATEAVRLAEDGPAGGGITGGNNRDTVAGVTCPVSVRYALPYPLTRSFRDELRRATDLRVARCRILSNLGRQQGYFEAPASSLRKSGDVHIGAHAIVPRHI
jgi:hypothetical protein